MRVSEYGGRENRRKRRIWWCRNDYENDVVVVVFFVVGERRYTTFLLGGRQCMVAFGVDRSVFFGTVTEKFSNSFRRHSVRWKHFCICSISGGIFSLVFVVVDCSSFHYRSKEEESLFVLPKSIAFFQRPTSAHLNGTCIHWSLHLGK